VNDNPEEIMVDSFRRCDQLRDKHEGVNNRTALHLALEPCGVGYTAWRLYAEWPRRCRQGASTPLTRQSIRSRSRCRGALLLSGWAIFYELFFEDAVTAARELEITLTSRNKEREWPSPCGGVPLPCGPKATIAP